LKQVSVSLEQVGVVVLNLAHIYLVVIGLKTERFGLGLGLGIQGLGLASVSTKKALCTPLAF